MRKIIALLMILLPLCGCCDPSDERDYTFSGSISREVLENYLSRAITMSDMFLSMGEPYLDENIRMLTNIGAKFAGRSVLTWGMRAALHPLSQMPHQRCCRHTRLTAR